MKCILMTFFFGAHLELCRLHRLQGQAAQAACTGAFSHVIFGAQHGRGITVLTTLLPQNLASGISVLMVVGGVINCRVGLRFGSDA